MHPYRNQPARKFWRSAISDRSYFDLGEVARPIPVSLSEKVATAGSCFAQHIGRQLAERGANYLDYEPAPEFIAEADRRRFGFGLYSARYGNIYTARQLLELTREAIGEWISPEPVWTKDGRYFDAKRPSVDPVGHADPDEVLALRRKHLAAVATLLGELDVFVFTLGLTEAWQLKNGASVFPSAPGVICGDFDPARYEFINYDFFAVFEDLSRFHAILKSINVKAKLILTVSPVPLAATASEDHILVANTYSKSVLRSVAGLACERLADCHYFPSYEIISCHPSRGMFFDPDLRTVNQRGVDFVMEHFFASIGADRGPQESEPCEVICDEERIETPKSKPFSNILASMSRVMGGKKLGT
jgi:hypothetical protein